MSFGCRLHNYIFWFFFFSLSLFFVFYCIFMILNKFCCLGFKAFKNIAATWNELQICRIRSFL